MNDLFLQETLQYSLHCSICKHREGNKIRFQNNDNYTSLYTTRKKMDKQYYRIILPFNTIISSFMSSMVPNRYSFFFCVYFVDLL